MIKIQRMIKRARARHKKQKRLSKLDFFLDSRHIGAFLMETYWVPNNEKGCAIYMHTIYMG